MSVSEHRCFETNSCPGWKHQWSKAIGAQKHGNTLDSTMLLVMCERFDFSATLLRKVCLRTHVSPTEDMGCLWRETLCMAYIAHTCDSKRYEGIGNNPPDFAVFLCFHVDARVLQLLEQARAVKAPVKCDAAWSFGRKGYTEPTTSMRP